MQFTEFDTEGNYDTLKIYDGEDSGGSLHDLISGGHGNHGKDIISHGNKMYLLFTSDGDFTKSGFRGYLTYVRGRLKLLVYS